MGYTGSGEVSVKRLGFRDDRINNGGFGMVSLCLDDCSSTLLATLVATALFGDNFCTSERRTMGRSVQDRLWWKGSIQIITKGFFELAGHPDCR